jgi:hypothetical protein
MGFKVPQYTFTVPHCTCGHAEGDHKSSGSSGLFKPRYGICLARGCFCVQFREDPEKAKTA